MFTTLSDDSYISIVNMYLNVMIGNVTRANMDKSMSVSNCHVDFDASEFEEDSDDDIVSDNDEDDGVVSTSDSKTSIVVVQVMRLIQMSQRKQRMKKRKNN